MACQTFDLLPDLETSIPKDIKVSLYYIAGYVMKKIIRLKRKYLMITTFYYQEYGDFLKEIQHSDLQIPPDTIVQWYFSLL